MIRHILILTLLGLLCLPALAPAQDTETPSSQTQDPSAPDPLAWKLDKQHSSVNFSIKHIQAQVAGHFDRFDVQLQFDPKDLDSSSIFVSIDPDSINTGVAKRDDHLRSADFFDVANYPEITFQSKEIRLISSSEYETDGELTMHGITRQVTLPFTYLGYVDHPAEECLFVLGMETVFPLARLDYHVGDGSFLAKGLVGEFAHLRVYLEFLRTKSQCVTPLGTN